MDSFKAFIAAIANVINTFGISDFIDIVIVSYLIYKTINLVRETRAGQLVKGILLLSVSYFVANLIELETISFLLKNVFQIGIIALVIMFQPELRRALEKVGRTKVADLSVFGGESSEQKRDTWENAIDNIVSASKKLGETKTGALMVIEQKTKLGEQIETGVEIDAKVEENLLCNIFFHNSPLHDGAVIIRSGRILAASCFLPKPQKEAYIATHLGSRHRASIGVSEVSDAITVVVSEETGTISIAYDGKLIRDFTPETLRKYLVDKLVPAKESEDDSKKMKIWRKKNEKV